MDRMTAVMVSYNQLLIAYGDQNLINSDHNEIIHFDICIF